MSPSLFAILSALATTAAAVAPNLPAPASTIVGAIAAGLTAVLGYLGTKGHAQLRAMRGGK